MRIYPRRNVVELNFVPAGSFLVFRHPFSVYVVNGLEDLGPQIFLKAIFFHLIFSNHEPCLGGVQLSFNSAKWATTPIFLRIRSHK